MKLTDEQKEVLARVNESHLQDPARAMDSLKNHSSSALRARVLAWEAQSNGHRPDSSIVSIDTDAGS